MSKSKIIKKDAPGRAVTIDYSIKDMHRYEGFFVATIHVMETGEDVTVHNRYGAWSQGNPAIEWGERGDLIHEVCFALADARARFIKDEEKDPLANNPFAVFAEQAPPPEDNPFMAFS